MKKLLAIATLVTGTLFLISCGDDNGDPVAAGNVSISGIPAAAQVASGDDLTVTGVTLTAEAGIASFTVSVDGGTATDLGATAGETSETVDITLSTDGLAVGLRTLVFTLTDAAGTEATVQHGLTVSEFGVVEITGAVSEDATWTSNNVYVLATRVAVESGVTLTIEPGTVIKGEAGTGTNATALLVARGGTLDAQGTATAPIVFTSIADELSPTDIANGDFASPNLDPDINGLWGGVIMLGDATISASASEVQIEGIPTSDANGLYGGTDDAHNGGTVSYISIRHGGANIGEGNEINGLTLGGVGTGTSINWVEVVANQDDGIEWFGGNVSIDGVVIWNSGDDGLDTDQDWQGTCSNFIIVTPDGGSAFELDGPEGAAARTTPGFHTFNNGTIYAGADIDHLVDWDDGTNAALTNLYFFGLDSAYLADTSSEIESFGGDGAGTSSAWQATLPSNANETLAVAFGGASGIVTSVAENANTVGVTSDDAFKWTFAGASGALDDIGL